MFGQDDPAGVIPSVLLVVVAALAALGAETQAREFPLQAVSGREFPLQAVSGRGSPTVVHRSTASTGVAVRLKGGQSLHLDFCLRQTTTVQVREVLYSNDGNSEGVRVRVDGATLGTFTSRAHSSWGDMWNVFIPSPAFTRTLALHPGWHSLQVEALLPSDGVEVDYVRLWLSDEGLSRAMLDCRLQCGAVPYAQSPPAGLGLGLGLGLQQGTTKQASYRTRCAEEDNVKIPIYGSGVTEYTVTASMPTYAASAKNRRDPNTTHCAFLSPVLWTFSRLPGHRGAARARVLARSTTGTAVASVLMQLPASGNDKLVYRVEFLLEGRSKGHVDSDIGSILTVRTLKSTAQIRIRCAYTGRTGRLSTMQDGVVYPGQTQYKVWFPDFTWREFKTNTVLLEFLSSHPVDVTDITLERRPMQGETVHTVFWSPTVVVEAVEVDFWWRRPETMTLRNGATGQVWARVDFFRVSLHVPWNGGFAQVLVMYQDGNLRLAPLPPPGVDWIPFGSSVIIGPSDPADLRPAAPIASVVFFPSTLRLNVRYRDGGSATLRVTATSQSVTAVKVSDIKTAGVKNSAAASASAAAASSLPFATLRSMHIDDSNSDVDSLLVDGQHYRRVMDTWGSLRGSSFFFFRRCESRHLTLSPDVRIDIEKTSSSFSDSGLSGQRLMTPGRGWWWQGDTQAWSLSPYAALPASPDHLKQKHAKIK